MPKSIRWRLTLSFAAIALVAAVVLGAILLAILQGYYSEREFNYLEGNARSISAVMSKILGSELSDVQVQSQIQALAFLSQTRVRIYDAQMVLRYDSGVPNAVALSLGIAQQRLFRTNTGGTPPGDFFQIISIDEKNSSSTQPFDPKLDLPSNGDKSVVLFKSLSAVGSPFGFDLSAETDTQGVRSNLSVTQELTTAGNSPANYNLELSDGPAYGRDILSSVAVGWAIASAIAILFAAGVGWLISRRISAPVLALTQVTTRMAHGDLATRADARGHDEFGQLAQSFNVMAERLETTIVMLRRFVSDAAHELGTPLTALKSNLDLMADEKDAGRRGEFLERAQTTVTRLESLSRDLLDLSRLEAHTSQTTWVNVNLFALVSSHSEVYASRAEQAGLYFETHLPDGPVWIRADAPQVQRAIANLLDNAFKFTPPGGTVQLALWADAAGAHVQVTDTGIGIPPEDIPHLFQRFHRARNASAYPGSGLGLAIVKAIMQDQQGNVQVEPLDAGTRFILTWHTV